MYCTTHSDRRLAIGRQAGFSDKKVVQWDLDAGDVTQEYDQHLGAVNTITFCDENRRFITSSDDKSIRVWEFGIPVVM
eukprot:7462198-Pyramimonas_sp.AAC.1